MPPSILAIFAHPDDESFGAAGTLAKYAEAGAHTALICVTRGEAGASNGLADNSQALAAIRATELQNAASTIGVTDLSILHWPDGQGADWDLVVTFRPVSSVDPAYRPPCRHHL